MIILETNLKMCFEDLGQSNDFKKALELLVKKYKTDSLPVRLSVKTHSEEEIDI